MAYTPSAIIVRFHRFATENEIENTFERNSVTGTEVSPYLKRYSVDVPVGREDHYVKLFLQEEIVHSVCPSVIKGFKPAKRNFDGNQTNSGNAKRP